MENARKLADELTEWITTKSIDPNVKLETGTHTPAPWRYEPGGGHAYNCIRGADSVQTHGWPFRRGGISNASYSDRICENLGDESLPGPAANIRLIVAAPDLLAALQDAALVINGMFTKSLPPCFAPTLEFVSTVNAAIAKATGK